MSAPARLALPHGEHAPGAAAQGAAVLLVAGGVVLDFGEPVVAAGGGDAAGSAGMSVPEAAVDEDDILAAGKDEVGRAGEGGDVGAVARSAQLNGIQVCRNFEDKFDGRIGE